MQANAESAMISGAAKIVDGDTLDVGVIRVRLFGIDAPETGQTCKSVDGKSWNCGAAAATHLADLTEGQTIECEPKDRDRYNRIVAICTDQNGNLNERMISDGMAWAFVKYSDAYEGIEAAAKKRHVGIWGGNAELPWEYRENKWQRAADASPRLGCPIKGNISRKGEKIYYTPWSPWYSRTKIDEDKGERWFCDEAEALAAGWRAPRRH
jgi:endonuclease YncB( thermonuclease family)